MELSNIFTPDEIAAITGIADAATKTLRTTDDRGNPIKLTPTETKVLVLISRGLASKEVADVLYISKRTVDFHLANVYEKLGTCNRSAAYAHARTLGVVA